MRVIASTAPEERETERERMAIDSLRGRKGKKGEEGT
jgi:hypothetical protein